MLAFLQDSEGDVRKTTRFLRFNINSQREDRIEGMHAAAWGLALPDDDTIVTFQWNCKRECLEFREETVTVTAAREHVCDLQLAPSGDTVATVGDDNVVKFWDVANWKQRETKLTYKHEGGKVLQFSPNGKYLVTLSEDGWLKCWDAPDDCHRRALEPAESAQPRQ